LQQDQPDDYVLATGETHTVRSFVEKAFAAVDVTLDWQGEGVEEKGIDTKTGKVLVAIDPRYFRPTEVELLIGNPAKAKAKLGWSHETGLDALVAEMMVEDLKVMAHAPVMHNA
ncbi:GDP-mannose 4,6-dehydratase, partial [Kaistia soli DSM 19436]